MRQSGHLNAAIFSFCVVGIERVCISCKCKTVDLYQKQMVLTYSENGIISRISSEWEMQFISIKIRLCIQRKW